MLALLVDDAARTRVAVVGADGSQYREIFSDVRASVAGLAWTHDGTSVVVGRRLDANRWELARVTLSGAAPRSVGIQVEDVPTQIDISPDGKLIATASVRTTNSVWALENVLAAIKR